MTTIFGRDAIWPSKFQKMGTFQSKRTTSLPEQKAEFYPQTAQWFSLILALSNNHCNQIDTVT